MNSRYFKILGLPEGSTKAEIKRAYKKKALKYHPDRNTNANAHDEFVKIKQAYEVLMGFKVIQKVAPPKKTRTTTRRPIPNYARKKQAEKESVGANHLNNLLDFGYIVLTVLFVLFIPIFGYYTYGFIGLAACIGVLLISSRMILSAFKNHEFASLKKLIESVEYLSKNTKFKIGIFSVITVILFFGVTMRHLISLPLIFSLSFVLPGIMVALMRFFKRDKWRSILIGGVYLSLFVQTFFAINYFGDSNTYTENYRFYNESGKRWNPSNNTFLKLEGDTYEEYSWLRFFPNYKKFIGKDEVILKFSDGLFGIKALKDYDFQSTTNY